MTKPWKKVPVAKLSAGQRELVKHALRVRKRAYAPYSKFKVGAALRDSSGTIHTGCNVENASYSLTICAERSAAVKMVSEGGRRIVAVALVSLSAEPIFPCGACLQVLHELGGPAVEVIAVGRSGKQACVTTMGDLLPGAFTKQNLLERE